MEQTSPQAGVHQRLLPVYPKCAPSGGSDASVNGIVPLFRCYAAQETLAPMVSDVPQNKLQGQVRMTAFRDDIEAMIPALRRYARALARDADVADDLVQDTLVRALRSERLFL